MPFTFSHPAIVLPLKYLPKKWFSFTGLIIGSMTPDFEYFLRMKVKSDYSHTLNGGRPSGVKGLSLQSPFVGMSFKVQWQPAYGAESYVVQILSGSQLLRTVETQYYLTRRLLADVLPRY